MASQITRYSTVYSTNCLSQHKKKSALPALCEGNPTVTGGLPSQRASNTENVSIWWHHHTVCVVVYNSSIYPEWRKITCTATELLDLLVHNVNRRSGKKEHGWIYEDVIQSIIVVTKPAPLLSHLLFALAMYIHMKYRSKVYIIADQFRLFWKLWNTKEDFSADFLISENHFLISENHFLISENQFLISKIIFWYQKMSRFSDIRN